VLRIHIWIARRGYDFGRVEFLDLFGEGFLLVVKTSLSPTIDEIPYCSPSIDFFEFSLQLLLIGAFDVLFLVMFPGDGAVALVGVGLVGVPVDGDFALHVVEGCVREGVRNSMYILRRST
jgi:hypothetical protein